MIKFFRTISIIVFIASCHQVGSAQELPQGFLRLTDSLITLKSAEYDILHSALKNYERDSILLEYFGTRSAAKGYRVGQIYAELQLGHLEIYKGNYQKASDSFLRALVIARQIENLYKRIQSLNQIGQGFAHIESIKDALDCFNEALQLARTIPNPQVIYKLEISKSLRGLGEIYHILEQYDLACEQFQQSLDSDIKLGNLEGQVINYQNLGRCMEAQGRNEEALNYYNQSQKINETVQIKNFNLINIAKVAHLKTHSGKEKEGYNELISIISDVEASGDPELRARVNNSLGCVLNRLEQYTEARKYLFRGLAIAQDIPLLRNVDVSNTLLSENYEAIGDYQNALDHYRLAFEARQKLAYDRNRRYVYEVISNAQIQKRQEVIESITRENEQVTERLQRNQTAMMVGGLLFILFSFLLFFLYRQFQLNNEKKILSMEQRILRSQMNPHFLFNALNAIKLYIIKNDQNNAINYLNKFSKLIRKILDTSSQKEITLKEELETISLYMNIENIRFDHSINFSIEIENDINTSLVKIPSLILQPFLENALWHGLSLKEGTKSLKLSVRRNTEAYIQIIIQDNGIGRVAAAQLKENRLLHRRSYGIAITRERLANFSKAFQNQFILDMKDLFNPDGTAAGTEVSLSIPTS
jgi:tetratricopeptide (TPR) repeat protein